MLTRFVCSSSSSVARTQQLLRTSFLVVPSRWTSDGDHTRSKAKEKAAEDLKTRQEKRWLDTVASDSEAIVKSERKDTKGQTDSKKDIHRMQEKTIRAIEDKNAKGHLHQHDVGRRDTQADRTGESSQISS